MNHKVKHSLTWKA